MPIPRCGNTDAEGQVTAGDSLGVLRAAIGSSPCEACVCDVDNDARIVAKDALITLQFAVGSTYLDGMRGLIDPGETCDTSDECCEFCVALPGGTFCAYGGDTCTNEECDGQGHCVTIGPSGACPSTTYSSSTTMPIARCGNTDAEGQVTAGDALGVLRAAIGSSPCEACVCDVDNDARIVATDALITLQFAGRQQYLDGMPGLRLGHRASV